MYFKIRIVLILYCSYQFILCSNDYDDFYDDELIPQQSLTTISSTKAETPLENLNGVGSTLSNHYQIITICNSLPSILKCQNKHHFLILERVIYSVSNLSNTNDALTCMPQIKCMQIDEKDQFNCTGSNICVFYPHDRPLAKCNNIQSNLTQLHITCVSLNNFKRYYSRKYNTLFKQQEELNKTFSLLGSKIDTTTHKNLLLTIDRISTIQNKSLLLNISNVLHSKQSHLYYKEKTTIAIIISCTFTLLVSIVLFLYAYYRIRIKQSKRSCDDIEKPSNEESQSKIENRYTERLYVLIEQLTDKLKNLKKVFTGHQFKRNKTDVCNKTVDKFASKIDSISEPIDLTNIKEPPNGESCNCLDRQDKLCDYCMMQIKKSPNLLFRKVPMDHYDRTLVNSPCTIDTNVAKTTKEPLASPTSLTCTSPYILYDIPEVEDEDDEPKSVSECYQEIQKF